MKTETMNMTYGPFLQYWLYAAFPHCHGLQRYLLRHFPYSQKWMDSIFGVDKNEKITPICRTVTVDQQKVTILLYRYHVEYLVEDREQYQPYFPYQMVKFLDNDTFFLLLPIVDLFGDGYSYSLLRPDLLRRLSEMALPKENIKEVADGICSGLVDADGAESEPLWVIWQETEDNLYGAEWWADEGEFHLFQQRRLEEGKLPNAYFSVPEGEDIFLWGKHILSQWISSLSLKNQNIEKTSKNL